MKYNSVRQTLVSDTECFANYWSIGFKDVATGRVKVFEKWNNSQLDVDRIVRLIRNWRIVTFNGNHYDIPMIMFALSGATNAELKNMNDDIIMRGIKPWEALKERDLRIPDWLDHIDVKEVSPSAPQHPSLKDLGSRLYAPRITNMPVAFDEWIGEHNIDILRSYHGDDLDLTEIVFNDLKDQIELRAFMSDRYGVDLRSKSDAQVAEAVMRSEIQKITGRKLYAPDIKPGGFYYKPPAYIKFESPEFRRLLDIVTQQKFIVLPNGKVKGPAALDEKIHFGHSVYTVGIGGLHSNEKAVSHTSNEKYAIKDRDFTSFYPFIILNQGMYPAQLGPAFLTIYRKVVEERVAAKKRGDANTAETLKIVLNGSFGKFGSPYSILYSPNFLVQTTITGQLTALMLIEQVERAGFAVLSANTDGFVTRVERSRQAEFDDIVARCEKDMGMVTEETEYRSIHSASVNDYVAFAIEKGVVKAKRKGRFAIGGRGQKGASGHKKTPHAEIVGDAVVAYLKDGTPIEDTIDMCTDPRKFVISQKIKGGGMLDDVEYGKVMRWYIARGRTGRVTDMEGKNIADSQGAREVMTLPECAPQDIDFEWYYREAYATLDDIGAEFEEPDGRTGFTLARLPDQKNIHKMDLSTRTALCGVRQETRRKPWVEYKGIPEGHRYCAKCRREEEI